MIYSLYHDQQIAYLMILRIFERPTLFRCVLNYNKATYPTAFVMFCFETHQSLVMLRIESRRLPYNQIVCVAQNSTFSKILFHIKIVQNQDKKDPIPSSRSTFWTKTTYTSRDVVVHIYLT